MRIIAGDARGRKLFAPDGAETRPTADRVREALFNILGARVRDAVVLDLFAGSGALALEAISRGAAFAALCDVSREAARAIERNIELLGAQNRTALIQADWRTALSRLSGHRFSLVFLDPPYRMADAYARAAEAMAAQGLLAEGAVIVMEHAPQAPPPLPDGFEVFDARRYGDTAVTLVRGAGARDAQNARDARDAEESDDRRLPGQL
jgi:16S rRNA (guanine966-N2)-methyltransferase